jgi:putative transposase
MYLNVGDESSARKVKVVIMKVGSRRILHFNVTDHPTAEWTLQQFRECVTGDEPYKYVIHDRDGIFSSDLDSSLESLGADGLEDTVHIASSECFL